MAIYSVNLEANVPESLLQEAEMDAKVQVPGFIGVFVQADRLSEAVRKAEEKYPGYKVTQASAFDMEFIP
jgi:hypothetical protein